MYIGNKVDFWESVCAEISFHIWYVNSFVHTFQIWSAVHTPTIYVNTGGGHVCPCFWSFVFTLIFFRKTGGKAQANDRRRYAITCPWRSYVSRIYFERSVCDYKCIFFGLLVFILSHYKRVPIAEFLRGRYCRYRTRRRPRQAC